MRGDRRRDFRLILAASLFYLAGPMALAPLVAGFAGELGGSEVLMGVAGGVMNGVSLLSRPFVGNLADRVDKRRLTVWGGLVMTAAALACVAARAPWMVVAARVAHGLGYACCSVCLSTWLADLLPRNRTASGMGLYGMMTALGMAVGPAIGVYCYQWFGYRVAFAVGAALTAAVVFLAARVRNADAPRVFRVAPEAGAGRLRLVEGRVVPVALIMMLFTLPFTATQAFLVTLTELEGLAVPVGLFFPIYAGVVLVLRLALRRILDRVPFGCFLAVSAVCAACGLLSLAAMRGFWLMTAAAVFMAGGYGMMCTVCQSTAILLARPGGRGLANGTYYVGIDLGMALGPLAGGFLLGHAPLGWFFPAFLLTVPALLAVYALGRGVFARLR